MEEKCEKYKEKNRKLERKATEKHKQLADFIKEVHTQLRNESEVHGAEEAWKIHMKQSEKLKNYAESMYQLATEHWKQNKDTTSLMYCRIDWIKRKCKQYFIDEEMKKFDDKESLLLKNIKDIEVSRIRTAINSKINVLDVGSCYNPFKTEDIFSVTAIDIAPYCSDVLKCDFLNLKVGSAKTFTENGECLIELPKNSFDAVIFSLLLEYIPCPKQRFLSCQKAYDFLREGGLLFIATPDSKHEGANRKIINTSWKVVLAKLGFMRIHYEKLPHLHCLIFRKCFHKESAIKRINWKKIPENDDLFSSMKIFIPQDFHVNKVDKLEENIEKFMHNDEELSSLFNELPYDDL